MRGVRIGEAPHPGPPAAGPAAEPPERSRQPGGCRPARCRACGVALHAGEVRVRDSAAQGGRLHRRGIGWYHLGCWRGDRALLDGAPAPPALHADGQGAVPLALDAAGSAPLDAAGSAMPGQGAVPVVAERFPSSGGSAVPSLDAAGSAMAGEGAVPVETGRSSPADLDRPPGRALRCMDWWDEIRPADLLHERVPTLSFCPEAFRSAAAEARAAAASFLLEDDTGRGLHARRGWLLLFAIDRLLFGGLQALEGHSDTLAERISDRLEQFWAGHWAAMWRASAPRRGGAGQTSTGIDDIVRGVNKQLRKGQLGRAIALAVGGEGTSIPAAEVATAFRQQCRAGLEEPGGLGGSGAAEGPSTSAYESALELEAAVAGELVRGWARAPRGAGAGPCGERFEHAAAMADSPAEGAVVAAAYARLSTGRVPADILDCALAASLRGVPKKSGGVRIVAAGGVPRRLVAKATCQAFKRLLREGAGPRQYACGRKRGAEQLHQFVSALPEARPGLVVVSLDLVSAFSRVRRSRVLEAVRDLAPELLPLAEAWLAGPSRHWVQGPGGSEEIQEEGLDQGCPLAMAFFCLAVRGVIDRLAGHAQELHGRSDAAAYADDLYVMCPPCSVGALIERAREELRPLGLELNDTKLQIWCPHAGPECLPEELRSKYVESLRVLGSPAAFARPERFHGDGDGEDWRDTEVTGFAAADKGAPILARTEIFLKRLADLHAAGVTAQDVVAMVGAWIGAAVNHFLRSGSASSDFAAEHDRLVGSFFGDLFGVGTDAAARGDFLEVLGLPLKLGGFGVRLAERRRPAAFLAAAETNLPALLHSLGLEGDAELRRLVPGWDAAVQGAEASLRAYGSQLPGSRWDSPDELVSVGRQGKLTSEVDRGARRALLGRLPLPARALLRGGGGPGGGAFLRLPSRREHVLPEADFLAYCRRRLLLPDPSGAGRAPCGRRGLEGQCCTCLAGEDYGGHAVQCAIGGGPVRRHNALAMVLYKWLSLLAGAHVALEQWLPRLDREGRDGSRVRAKLDVIFHPVDAPRCVIDVSVTDSLSADPDTLAQRAANDFAGVRAREAEKHARYPTAELVPFVLDAQGRFGQEALAFLRWVGGSLPPGSAGGSVAELRQSLSSTLARWAGAQLTGLGRRGGGAR